MDDEMVWNDRSVHDFLLDDILKILQQGRHGRAGRKLRNSSLQVVVFDLHIWDYLISQGKCLQQ